MRSQTAALFVVGFLFVGGYASSAFGNPVVVYSPNSLVMGLTFFDVVLIEAIVLAWITRRPFLTCGGASVLANAVSTIPGVVVFSRSFDDSARLLLGGDIGVIILVQVAGSFLLSIAIEYLVLRALWWKSPWKVTAQATLVANVVSYLLVTPLLLRLPRMFFQRW